MTKTLTVHFNKIFVGTFEQNPSGRLSFSYDQKYLESSQATPLSISLPLRPETFDDKTTRAFFSGLLPDDHQREVLAKNLGLSPRNPFALLFKVGGDCAGAIEMHSGSLVKNSKKAETAIALTEAKLSKIIDELRIKPLLAGSNKAKLSLAGAQSKLAVFFDEKKKKSLPKLLKNTPSTHILKPIIPNFPDSSHNEFFCMKLAEEIDLDVAKTFLKFADKKPYLLIRRYDRELDFKGCITRIHQEDFCQAMSIPPELKYQQEGGPSILSCLSLIEKHSSQAALDKLKFLRAIIFNFLVGNSDAHGKNFSFLHEKNRTKLAPLYDLISTTIYSQLDKNMAMKIGKVSDPERLFLAHWHSIIAGNNTAKSNLNKELKTFADKLPIAAKTLQKKLQKNGISSPVFDDIIAVINKRAARILGYFN
jgi:serine/threonine-protein kinase HipA